jgi:hypothetical protein
MNITGIFTVSGASHWTERFFVHNFGKSDNCVQWCAQLMAHNGKKLGFGAVAPFGFFLGSEQSDFCILAYPHFKL